MDPNFRFVAMFRSPGVEDLWKIMAYMEDIWKMNPPLARLCTLLHS